MTKLLGLRFICITALLCPAFSFAGEPKVTGDPFVDIPANETALKLLKDNGNDCHFVIDDPKSVEALSTKITKLYDMSPIKRGDTLAWSVKNVKQGSNQAKQVNILIMDTSSKTASLKMDRRKGQRGRNPLASDRMLVVSSRRVAKRTPPPSKTPPPASTD